jgi:hypothetical protein
MGFLLKYSGATPNVIAKVMRGATKPAYEKAGIFWHREHRPKHFTTKGGSEYNYQARQGERGSGKAFKRSYTARKLRKYGHTRPMVWSGQSEAFSRIRDVRSTSKGVRVVMALPRHFFQFRKDLNQPNLAEELSRVSEAEQEQIAKVLDAEIQQQLDASTESSEERV